ncbi:MAG TPA: hypothetical protein VHX61_07800 [Rhizomicrobium sp.]|jgi:hypothetical protein|nr:hypothetical protein [Rhizomicrobium sp.]
MSVRPAGDENERRTGKVTLSDDEGPDLIKPIIRGTHDACSDFLRTPEKPLDEIVKPYVPGLRRHDPHPGAVCAIRSSVESTSGAIGVGLSVEH